MKFLGLNDLKRFLLMLAGALLMALDVSTFVHSASLFPGGMTGVALLIQETAFKYSGIKLPFSILVYIFNIVPVYIGFRFIGKKFTIYSLIMIVISGFMTDVFSTFNWSITNDMLLCSVFGGILNALSVSLCLFADSSSGGTDFIAIFISEKTGKSAWNYIFAFNCVILIAAGFLLGWDKALYSIIFQYTSTQAVDFFYRKYSKTTLLIITDKPDEIYEIILLLTNHSATVFEGTGEYSGQKHFLLYSVVSSSESGHLEKAIRTKDPNAFINVLHSKEILGRFFKRQTD